MRSASNAIALLLLNLNTLNVIVLSIMHEKGGLRMGENTGYAIAIIMSFVVTIVSFIIMLVNETRFHRKDTHRFDDIDKETSNLAQGHKELSNEHQRMEEHVKDYLRDTEASLSRQVDHLAGQTGMIKDDLIRFIAKEEGVKEKVAEILPKEDRVLYEVQALYKKLSELSGDNDALRKSLERSEYMRNSMEKEITKYQEEVAGLRKQVLGLTREIRTFKNPGYDEPEL